MFRITSNLLLAALVLLCPCNCLIQRAAFGDGSGTYACSCCGSPAPQHGVPADAPSAPGRSCICRGALAEAPTRIVKADDFANGLPVLDLALLDCRLAAATSDFSAHPVDTVGASPGRALRTLFQSLLL